MPEIKKRSFAMLFFVIFNYLALYTYTFGNNLGNIIFCISFFKKFKK